MVGVIQTDSTDDRGAARRRIILADPRGFCAGVDRAILTVKALLKASEGKTRPQGLPPVYVRRQIVHNKHVVADLATQGAVFVQELSEVPDAAASAGIPVVFSAHGVSPDVKSEAAARGINVVDATCPLVAKVHREVLRYAKEGYEIIYIGHRGHDEAVGVVGEDPGRVHLIQDASDIGALSLPDGAPLVYLTQTTLSADETRDTIEALKARFPEIQEPPSSDICYATQNRQTAVKAVAARAEAVIVVGSANSSNSMRLVEVAQDALGERGTAHRVDDAGELDASWFDGVRTVGITSGASVPDELVEGVVESLESMGFDSVETLETVRESTHFVLPAAVRPKRAER